MPYILNLKLKKEPVKKAISAVSVFLIITIFAMSLMSFFSMPQYARAANDYIDPNGDGSVGSWSSTGANYYTEIDEAIRQPSTPTTTDYISALSNASGNIFINMDSFTDVATATDVTIWIYHNDGANGELYMQLWDDDESTTRSTEQVITQRTTDTWDSITFSSVNLTQAQLDTLSVRIRSVKNGGGPTATVYVYELYGYVTYSEVQHVVVSTSGTQTASMNIPSVDQYVDGKFVITEQVSSRSITDITITETGSVDASANLDNIELYYDLDTSAPYDCVSESFSGTSTETQFGSTDTDGFSSANGTSTFSGTVTITTTQTMCVYVVLDVTSGTSDGDDLDVQITNPSTDVVASAGNVSPAIAVALAGSTTLNKDDVVVSANGTQTSSMNIPSVDQYVDGSFVMLGQNTGTVTITDVTITETGTVDAQSDLDNIELYYEYDTSAPYDCASVSFSGTSTETQFGVTDTDGFSSANGTSTFSGTATASTTQAVCFYTVLDVTSGASNGELLDIQITNPSTEVVLSSGTVTPNTAVAILGSTQLSLDDVVVSSTGTQTANMDIPSVNQYVDGSFAMVGQTAGTHTITDVTITETGSVNAQTGLDNIELYYEYDTSAPYDCASESYGGAEAQFGSTDTDGFSSANGASTFSEIATVTASTTQAVCLYTVLDVTSGASNGESLNIQITNPSTEVVLSVGGASPATPIVIAGSTNLNEIEATFTQSNYRIYENIDALQPTTPLAVENTSTSDIVSGQVIRFRVNILVGSTTLATSSQSFKLQYAEKGGAGSCTDVAGGNFADVGQIASSTIWRGYNNTPADGATTTATLLASSTVNETYEETNPSVSNVYSIPVDDYGEWDWVVRNNGAISNTTYCFRMTKDDGIELDGYDNMPEVTTRTSATWRELENTPTTVEKNESVRLRVQVDNQGNISDSASYRLEFSTSTAGSWTAVPIDAACSSTAEDFRICPSDHYVDLDRTTNRLTVPGGSSFITGYMLESSNPASSVTKEADEFTEMEWHMQATNSATDGETYYFQLTDSGTSVGTYSVFPELTILAATSTLMQNYYRFYVDNDALKPTDPWPVGATDLGENTEITVGDTPLDSGDVIRIRMSAQISGRDLATTSQNFKFQFGEKVTTCGAISDANWHNIGAIGSTTALWRGTSTTPVDGTVLSTNPPTGGDLLLSVSDRAGTFEEENSSALNPYNVSVTEDVEYDWIVENNNATPATGYCFRMIKGNDSVFDTYIYYPALVTVGYEARSQNWRWYDDENNETPASPLALENTAPPNIAQDNIIKLRLTLKEVSGAAGSNAKFRLQFSEASDFSSGVSDVMNATSCTALSLWCYDDGGGIDNQKISSSTLSDADSCVAGVGNGCGTHNEFATTTGIFTHPLDAASEYEFTIRQASARVNATYFFRAYDVVNDREVSLNTAETHPSLSTEGSSLAFTISGLPAGTTTENIITDITTTATSVPFGSLEYSTETEAAQRLTVTTNATEGYQIFMYARQEFLNLALFEIEPVSSTNASPANWNTGCTAPATGCYGYHTSDSVLSGGSARFVPEDTYAKFSTTTLEEIAYNSGPVMNESTDVVYKTYITSGQNGGDYETNVVYIVVPAF